MKSEDDVRMMLEEFEGQLKCTNSECMQMILRDLIRDLKWILED